MPVQGSSGRTHIVHGLQTTEVPNEQTLKIQRVMNNMKILMKNHEGIWRFPYISSFDL